MTGTIATRLRTILFVDDEPDPMRDYIRALQEADFNVIYCLGPDDALEVAEKEGQEIAAIVLDIMMPPGEKYRHLDTKEGLMTGVFLYDDLKKKCPEATIIVLTNVTDPEVLDEIRKKNHVKTLQKLDYTPYEVADLLIDVFTPPWSTQIEEDIQTLLSLPEGWDSHGARHVDPDIAEAAIQLLREVSQLTTPPPAVVPTVRGGIQIEWHTGGIDLEIEFTSPTRMHVAYEKGEEEYEGFASKLTEPNVERIRQFVETLSHPK